MSSIAIDAATVSVGLLIARLALGIAMAAHGTQKLFGWFGGYGIKGTGGFLSSIGFHPGAAFATAAGLGEVISGLLIAAGFLGPIGSALLISVMVVAMLTVHVSNGFWAAKNGIEVPFLYAAGALALAFTGPGLYSIDATLGLGAIWTPTRVVAVLALGVLGGLGNLLLRRQAPAVVAQN
jgi:putative oxidoreductase